MSMKSWPAQKIKMTAKNPLLMKSKKCRLILTPPSSLLDAQKTTAATPCNAKCGSLMVSLIRIFWFVPFVIMQPIPEHFLFSGTGNIIFGTLITSQNQSGTLWGTIVIVPGTITMTLTAKKLFNGSPFGILPSG